MQKDFDAWNAQKKQVDLNALSKLYHEREVWWCVLGVNIGFEQDGSGAYHERPVLIVRGISRNTCFVVPLTTSDKVHRLRISVGTIDGKVAKALISQLRLVDTKRLINKIATLEQSKFMKIKKAIEAML